jgi:hypothetical protein
LIIVITSVIDASLVVYVGTLVEDEYNPVGKFLIGHYGQWGLFWVKLFGTMLVIVILIWLRRKNKFIGEKVAIGLVIFQVLLMGYLFS